MYVVCAGSATHVSPLVLCLKGINVIVFSQTTRGCDIQYFLCVVSIESSVRELHLSPFIVLFSLSCISLYYYMSVYICTCTQQCGRGSGETWPAEAHFICKEQPEQWRRSPPTNGETVPLHWPQVWTEKAALIHERRHLKTKMSVRIPQTYWTCMGLCVQKPSSEWDSVEKFTAGSAWHAAERLHLSKTGDMSPGIALPQQIKRLHRRFKFVLNKNLQVCKCTI